ncbi:MAG: TrkH family potassium uptake protein [Nitrospirota bacterium]|nr:TrkH family potassium uptake protein [Nitrospirota bacterium]MDH5767621.1 TrkH family potassium uptake protein [Nitrospirota bacterium]
MNIRVILNVIGIALIFISFFMIFPVIISLIYKQSDTITLAISFFITLISGSLLFFLTHKHKREEIRHRDAFIIVTFTWIMMSFFASIPFMLSGTFHSFTDAYFESMAGFTTTGASVLKDFEVMPKGIMFWRCMTQWIGGMGIIVFALAILPMLGTGGMQLFKAEVPEVSVDKLRPRFIDTAKALWFIYFALTSINAVLLMAFGMDFYDAICHAFTTMATGGFSTKNESMAYFKSPPIEYITSLFMFLAGVNYSLYFYVFKGKLSGLWKSNEFKFYLTVTAIATLLITISVWTSSSSSIIDSFRYSLFQVVSLMTTTGYATADFEKWTSFAQIILVTVMFFGGMIGSTGGGIKQVRILLMLKQGYREMYQLIHPRAITTVKLDDKFLDKEVLGSIWGFVFLFLGVCIIATIGMAAVGTDIITSATTVISATCNVGPALGDAGPAENYASIPDAGKWILIFCMLTGRLEVYTVLILLIPHFWKK